MTPTPATSHGTPNPAGTHFYNFFFKDVHQHPLGMNPRYKLTMLLVLSMTNLSRRFPLSFLSWWFHTINLLAYHLHLTFPAVTKAEWTLGVLRPSLGGKEFTWNAGDAGDSVSIPGSGRSPGGGNGNPLQYSCLENPMDRESFRLQSWKDCKQSDMTEQLSTHAW